MSLTKSPLRAEEDLGDTMVIHHLVVGYEVHLRERDADVFAARVEVVAVYRGETMMHSIFTQRWQYEVKPSRAGAKVSLAGIVNERDFFICPSKWTLPTVDAYLREVAKVAWQLRASTKKWSLGRPLDPAFGALAKPFEQTRRERRAAGTEGPRPATKPPPKRPERAGWEGPDFAPFAPFTPFTPFGTTTARPKPAARAPKPPPPPPPQPRVSAEDMWRAAEAFERIARQPPSEPAIPPRVRAALGVLGLPANALPDAATFKAAWARAAHSTHPDTGGSEAAFVEANQAREVVRVAMAGGAS